MLSQNYGKKIRLLQTISQIILTVLQILICEGVAGVYQMKTDSERNKSTY